MIKRRSDQRFARKRLLHARTVTYQLRDLLERLVCSAADRADTSLCPRPSSAMVSIAALSLASKRCADRFRSCPRFGWLRVASGKSAPLLPAATAASMLHCAEFPQRVACWLAVSLDACPVLWLLGFWDRLSLGRDLRLIAAREQEFNLSGATSPDRIWSDFCTLQLP